MGLTEGWVTGDPAVSERRALPARVWAAYLIAIEQLSYPPGDSEEGVPPNRR
jgi:hypothetical protein